MNREEAIKTLKGIAAAVAEKYGYTEMCIGQDRQKGIWGEEFTKFLEESVGGDCSSEINWRKPGNEDDYVEFRFRFSNPCIAIRFRENDRETLASLEFRTQKYVPDGVYEEDGWVVKKGDKKYKAVEIPCELSEVQLFNPVIARSYMDEMEKMWNEAQN